MGIGTELRRYREKRHLTQEELGQMVGLERSFVSRVERDEARLSVEALGQIVVRLGWSRRAIGDLL